MVLIKCPECNSEISDKAQACPYCGYGITPNELSTNPTKQKMTTKVGWFFGIVIFVVVLIVSIFIIKQKRQDDTALMYLSSLVSHSEDVQEYKTYAVMEIDNEYFYHESGAKKGISDISQRLSNLDMCIEYLDEHYAESQSAIDKEVEKITSFSCRTWLEYRERLNANYYIDSDMTDNERAEEIVSRYVSTMID